MEAEWSETVSSAPNRILIVDDEQLNLDMLSRRLRRCGFAVEVALSGSLALDKIRTETFDLILLDQMMPGMSGSEVLRRLRAEFPRSALPIIMVTAVADSDRIATALTSGANDYITKPIDFKVALARIQSELDRKHTEDALQQSEQRYALAAEASKVGLWDWNLVTGQVYFSSQWRQMLGIGDGQDSEGKDLWYSRVLPQDRAPVVRAIEDYLLGRSDVLNVDYRVRHADGTVRWMTSSGIVTRDQKGEAIRLAGTQREVTDEKTKDPLTGLPNLTALLAELGCALDLARLRIDKNGSYGFFFIDLDGFKTINDRLGHLVGDQLLKSVANRLRLVVSQFNIHQAVVWHAIAARLRGDGFAVFLRQGATRASAEKLSAAIQGVLSIPFDLGGRMVRCTFSIGASLASPLQTQPDDVLRDADIAMCTAKRQGRGAVAIFDSEMHAVAAQQLDLEREIRFAAERNELEVFYQPKTDLRSGLTYGVEALLRWKHPKFGLLQPGQFIKIAEDTGAIVDIGKWVRNQACHQVRAWQGLFPARTPLELSVNLSPREFAQPDLVEEIDRTLVANDFPPSSLHLEITEGIFVGDFAAARLILSRLKGLGIYLDLDDFGTGYSSLQYLRELPFDLIKIDRYFVKSLDTGESSATEMLQTMLSMTRNFGMEVVAEGVETLEHSVKLRELGFVLCQGYFYSKPVSARAMEALLSKESNTVANARTALPSRLSAAAVVPIAGAV